MNASSLTFSVSISVLILMSRCLKAVKLEARTPSPMWRQLFSKSWHSA